MLLHTRRSDYNSQYFCKFQSWIYACALDGYFKTSLGMSSQLPLRLLSHQPVNVIRLQVIEATKRYLETSFRVHQQFFRSYGAPAPKEGIKDKLLQRRVWQKTFRPVQ